MVGVFRCESDNPVSARHPRFNMHDTLPVAFTSTRNHVQFADIWAGNLAAAHHIQSEVEWNAVTLDVPHHVIHDLDATGEPATASSLGDTSLGITRRSM